MRRALLAIVAFFAFASPAVGAERANAPGDRDLCRPARGRGQGRRRGNREAHRGGEKPNIQPTKEPRVYNSLDLAVKALQAKQIDGVVADLGSTFYMRDAQLTDAVIVGELPTVGEQEHFSVVLTKGSSLTPCVNVAIAAIKADGSLDAARQQYITSEGAPKLQ